MSFLYSLIVAKFQRGRQLERAETNKRRLQASQLGHSCGVTYYQAHCNSRDIVTTIVTRLININQVSHRSHVAGMDTSGSPVPDAIHSLLERLQEALVLEVKYQPGLQLPVTTQNDEITIGTRDGSAHVLRCLKVWYDLPSDVLFIAINLIDRFLTKMKARPKHMACISVASFHIAAVQMAQSLDADHLVSISQCKCTGGDLKRMSDVIGNKLEWQPGTTPITSLTFLRLFNVMFHAAASELGLGELYASTVTESELLLRLEMVACDGNCASLRASEVALVLICTYLDSAVNRLDANADATMSSGNISGKSAINIPSTPAHQMLRLVEFAAELQKMCKITDESFFATHELVSAVLSKYNAQEQTPHRQRLVWRLSSRTARLLRPTDKFTSVLPVIAEHAPVSSPSRIRKSRKFARRHGNKRR